MTDVIIRAASSLIDAVAAALVAFYALRALYAAAASNTNRAKFLMADGVLTALTWSVAATLLKAIGLRSWHEIGMFAFALTFRTAMKRVFAAERKLSASKS